MNINKSFNNQKQFLLELEAESKQDESPNKAILPGMAPSTSSSVVPFLEEIVWYNPIIGILYDSFDPVINSVDSSFSSKGIKIPSLERVSA